MKFLNAKFKKLKIGKYKKNDKRLFEILTTYGQPSDAIRWSEKRINVCKDCSETESCPATRVHELVIELAKYLPDDLKSRYLYNK